MNGELKKALVVLVMFSVLFGPMIAFYGCKPCTSDFCSSARKRVQSKWKITSYSGGQKILEHECKRIAAYEGIFECINEDSRIYVTGDTIIEEIYDSDSKEKVE
mgnify:CR=1 FL=1